MLNDMLKEIKQFKETSNLEFKNEDILVVYQYVLQKKEYLKNDNNPFEPVLEFNPTRIELRPSKRYQDMLDKAEKKETLIYHNDYILDAYLEDFETFNDERVEALKVAKEFLENYFSNKLTKGLYVFGKNRTGKTFLLSAIANELALKNVKVVFAYIPDLIRNIHSGMNDNTLEEKVKLLKECQVLILDDLGSAVMSSWFRDQVFGSVIQYRLSLGLPVIISSNLNITQLENHLIDPKIDDDRFNTVRIITRINELTTPVQLTKTRY